MGALSCHAPHARAAWSQSLKNMIFGDSIVAVAGLGPASDGRVEVAGSMGAKVELEVGGCCPGRMGLVQAGEKHWGARAVHTLERGSQTGTQQEHARGPGPKCEGKGGGGRGESVAAAQQGGGPLNMQVEPLTLPLPSRATVPLQQGESVC